MDGIHDLGGKHGFGKVDVEEGEEQFHEAWEARVRAMVNGISRAPDWNLDWFRHCRELIDPVDYLSRPYLDQWVQTYAAMLVNSGWATVEEIANGKSDGPTPADANAPMSAADVKATPMRAIRFDKEIDAAPAYGIGDAVRATYHASGGHTRLPAYVRGHVGWIHSHRGAHVYPDDNALGVKRHEHLYTVEFKSTELWAEVTDSNDTISLEMWESYLEPA